MASINTFISILSQAQNLISLIDESTSKKKKNGKQEHLKKNKQKNSKQKNTTKKLNQVEQTKVTQNHINKTIQLKPKPPESKCKYSLSNMSNEELKKYILFSDVLGTPVCKKRRN